MAAQQGIFFNQQHANKGPPPQNMNSGSACNTNASNMNNNQQPHVPQPNNNPQSKHLRMFDDVAQLKCISEHLI